MPKRREILGVGVDVVGRREALETIESWLEEKSEKLRFVATVYSEFLVRADGEDEFKRVLNEADLAVPDGISVLAAVRYQDEVREGKGKLLSGWRVGGEILGATLGETVTGVFLFEELVKRASDQGWRVFLLGGFGDGAGRLTENLKSKYPSLRIDSDPGNQKSFVISTEMSHANEMEKSLLTLDRVRCEERPCLPSDLAGKPAGRDSSPEFNSGLVPSFARGALLGMTVEDEENERVIEKINSFRPDLLFVAYGPVKQEKWIVANREKLRVKVAIGVGGTFDEVLGDVARAPVWMEKRGLKWLWRLMIQPKRIGRIYKAVVVFPWKVFRAV